MPKSRAQVRLAHAVLAGDSSKLPMSLAREMVSKTRGRKMSSLPERKRKKGKRLPAFR